MKTLTLLIFAAYARPEILVETEWLAEHLSVPGMRLVELRRGGLDDYAKGHIPGAVGLPNAALRDPTNPPSFLPSLESFEKTMGELGIDNQTRVVVYDDRGGLYAARLWWALQYFGHSNVAFLNGGLVKWNREGRPLSVQSPRIEPARFVASPHPEWLATSDDVLAAIAKPGFKILDARTSDEIEGRDLRGIKRGGIIESSIPLYWEDTFDPESKALLAADALWDILDERGIGRDDSIIVYCQVGMRASHDLFVLYLLGFDNLRNYYGAWEEWGNREDLPIATVSAPKR
jgi:thiosulfate/3-mercaptopyruvate sulfurtransferase